MKDKKDKKDKRDPENTIPAFTTLPAANAHDIEIDSRVTVPSESDLKEARDWVNHNAK